MTPIMKRTENKENAVSPVVGVMLMLVVTIIIAAVVAMFATGVATDVSTAPNAVLDVHIYSDKAMLMSAGNASVCPTHAPDLVIRHLGGDDLNTGNLSLTFSWKNNGKSYRTVYDGSAIGESSKVTVTKSGSENWVGTSALYMNDGQNYAFDMDYESESYGSDNPDLFFGKVTLKSGYQLQSLANYLDMNVNHKGNPAMDAVMGAGLNTEGSNPDFSKTTGETTEVNTYSVTAYNTKGVMTLLPKGTSVHVVITDLKSNTAIFDKEVAVE